MAEAYSMTNQELKGEGWGTTNIGVISNRGCKTVILVGVDSRATCPFNNGFILSERAKKYVYMENCNVLATMAGNSLDCTHILSSVDYARGRACGGVVNNGIHGAPIIARSYIADWFEKCGPLLGVSTPCVFDGCLIMAGWDARDVPYLYDVQRSEVRYKTISEEYDGFVNGSGRERVQEYFRTCKKVVQSSNELLKHVIIALLCATLFDQNSGGYLCVFDVRKTYAEVVYHQTVLAALFAHYNDLASYLSHSLFFIVETKKYPYTHDNNLRLHDRFRIKLPKYRENVVVRRGDNYTVRLAHFDNADAQLYEQLRRENRQRDVTPETEALMEEFGLEQFEQDVIWFGLPTRKLVEALDLWKL